MVAREIQPWAATPYLQLALVQERAGDLPVGGYDDRLRDRALARAGLATLVDRGTTFETKLGRVEFRRDPPAPGSRAESTITALRRSIRRERERLISLPHASPSLRRAMTDAGMTEAITSVRYAVA